MLTVHCNLLTEFYNRGMHLNIGDVDKSDQKGVTNKGPNNTICSLDIYVLMGCVHCTVYSVAT